MKLIFSTGNIAERRNYYRVIVAFLNYFFHFKSTVPSKHIFEMNQVVHSYIPYRRKYYGTVD